MSAYGAFTNLSWFHQNILSRFLCFCVQPNVRLQIQVGMEASNWISRFLPGNPLFGQADHLRCSVGAITLHEAMAPHEGAQPNLLSPVMRWMQIPAEQLQLHRDRPDGDRTQLLALDEVGREFHLCAHQLAKPGPQHMWVVVLPKPIAPQASERVAQPGEPSKPVKIVRLGPGMMQFEGVHHLPWVRKNMFNLSEFACQQAVA